MFKSIKRIKFFISHDGRALFCLPLCAKRNAQGNASTRKTFYAAYWIAMICVVRQFVEIKVNRNNQPTSVLGSLKLSLVYKFLAL